MWPAGHVQIAVEQWVPAPVKADADWRILAVEAKVWAKAKLWAKAKVWAEAKVLQDVPDRAAYRTRPPGNLPEHADRPSLQDADRAVEPAPTDKVAGEEDATPMVMSAAAEKAKAKTTVSADDSRIARAIDARLGDQDDAAIRDAGRPPNGLAETTDGEPRWDSALAGEPVSAGAALVGKEPDNEAGTQIIMSAAADAVRGGTAVGADDSRIER